MATTMASATVIVNSIGVLAARLIADFGLTRAEVGGLVTAFGVTATALSVPAGRTTDRVGGRQTLAVVYGLSIVALLALAAAPSYTFLAIALGLGGVANAGANPGTNALIGAQLPAGRRGLVTGVKMSGVQLGVFGIGVGLPLGFETFGWRPTMAMLSLLPVAGLGWLLAMLPKMPPQPRHDLPQVTPTGIRVLAVYTFLMSAASAATITYIPLFSEEQLGLSPVTAGLTVALAGIVAVAGRIAWGTLTERTVSPATTLTAVALGSAIATGTLLATATHGTAVLWPAVVMIGATATSYNAAATMALLRLAPPHLTGRASGVIFTGFLGGLAVGPIAFGTLVDASSSYTMAWLAAVGTFVLALVVAVVGVRATSTAAGMTF